MCVSRPSAQKRIAVVAVETACAGCKVGDIRHVVRHQMQKLLVSTTDFGGGDTEVLTDVAAEVGCRGETEAESNLSESQRAVAQKAGELYGGVTVNPISRSAAADGFASLGEVFGRDAETGGIVGDVAAGAVVAALQHLKEAVHKVRVGVAEVVLLVVNLSMEVKEIDNHALHGIEGQVQVEAVSCFGAACADVLHILQAALLLARVEVHDGVVEEHHVPARAVVGERHRHPDKLRCDVDGDGSEIGTCISYPRGLAPLHNDTVARLQRVRRPVEKERRSALQA